jgi:hypothetical protein
MTFLERANAVAEYGFTPRQAAFLTTVMLPAGVCLPRQCTTFCGIVFGHTTRDFFSRLTTKRFATAHQCWRRGAPSSMSITRVCTAPSASPTIGIGGS